MHKYGIDFPIYVDSFNKVNIENTYNPWPERAFIIYENQLQYIAHARIEGVFWQEEIEQWLKDRHFIEN